MGASVPTSGARCLRHVAASAFYVMLGSVLLWLFVACGTYRDWPYKIEGDGKYHHQYLVSIAQDGDLDFSDDYRVAQEPWMGLPVDHYGYAEMPDPHTGRPKNAFPVGAAVLWTPAYLVCDLLAAALGLPRDPWSRFYQYA